MSWCCCCLSDVLLAAVRELAGPDQPKLFSSAALVVNTLKVIQTLEQIGEQLQVSAATHWQLWDNTRVGSAGIYGGGC